MLRLITVFPVRLVNNLPSAPHLARGAATEQLACNYLQANGLHLLQRNYRLRGGEIDLIMQDGAIVVFVEVRYRRTTSYGGATASIDSRKQQRLLRTAAHYLQYYAPAAQARFDIIAVEGSSNHIQWIKNAFDGGY